MTIYLAHPIDHHNRDIELDLDIIARSCRKAGSPAVFIPGRGWNEVNVKKHSNLQRANLAVIDQSDALVAYLPVGVETIGVTAEIAHAKQVGKPIVIIRGDGTCPVSLQPYGAKMLPEVALDPNNEHLLEAAVADALIEASRDKTPDPRPRMTAKYDGDGAQPEIALHGDAGFDIAYHGDEPITIEPGEKKNIPSGISYQMPPGYWSLILGRSSTFAKRNLLVPPSVIDAGYTGPIFAICWNIGDEPQTIQPGDRLAQIVPMPLAAEWMNWIKAPLDQTQRGSNGFGSTGK